MMSRLIDSAKRLAYLSRLMGGLQAALKFMLIGKFCNRDHQGQAYYKGLTLSFRRQDVMALKEVCIDEEYSFLNEYLNLQKPQKILDIGAHIGTFAIWTGSRLPNAHILSLEADPQTFAVLQSNCEANKALLPGWHALNRAAWKDNATVKIAASTNNDSMGHKIDDKGYIPVTGISFAELLNACPDVDFMKIDIEGAEEAFLMQDPQLLRNVKALCIELHPRRCNTDCIETTLQRHFRNIRNVKNRQSSNPLLFCHN